MAIRGTLLNDEDKSWKDFWLKSRQEEAMRLEETAKYMTGLIAILITIFQLNADLFKDTGSNKLVEVAVISWVFAVFGSVFVLFPKSYGYNPNFMSEVPTTFQKIVSFKKKVLFGSLLFFIIGLSLLTINFTMYRSSPEKKKDVVQYIIIKKDSLTAKTILEILPDSTQKQ